ncbi:MAG: glycogen debranching protein [Rhodocyclaceae bacterium]|nr:glycogen debranching protein [Rhodocyclaceae bacterium]
MAYQLTAWPGRPYPLGATWDGQGVNFALFSEHGEQVDLCLFDPKGRREIQRLRLPERTDHVWHGYLPEARPGLLYGYRVHGPYDPGAGHRFNPQKLLLDPYARDIVGTLQWRDAHFGYRLGGPREDLAMDQRDSAFGMPKCRVVDEAFTWGDDQPPATPWSDTLIYELHVDSFTRLHPGVPQALRGKYAALATAPVIDHLLRVGVTAVELLPVHAHIDGRYLLDKGLCNYWGYSSIGYFAPDGRYCASGTINEFKSMVKSLHSAGIEVILDVVYNHTAEGSHLGPTLCFRGIDNAAYYRLAPEDPRYYMDYTGCGNTLNVQHPRVLQLVADSLRYWVEEMHVDGFRFDLASALAREANGVDRSGGFLDVIQQDPVLSRVKLIAEPWDLGEGGYQVGNFPAGWSEWNDRYRDTVRSYWKGDDGQIAEIAFRIAGSSDLFAADGRRPTASINFVTVHDGFTLEDLVSYNDKHNEANQEDNRDGPNNNLSWNCGAEGPTGDPAILALRRRQKRNLMATLLLSQGVPMLLAADPMGHSQGGNNNAYCQENRINWIDWDLSPAQEAFFDFVARLVRLRKEHPVFRRCNFFQGRPIKGGPVKDIVWLKPDNTEFSAEDWNHYPALCFGFFLAGSGLTQRDRRGRRLRDGNFLLLFNAHYKPQSFVLPGCGNRRAWEPVLDTAWEKPVPSPSRLAGGAAYPLEERSMAVLQLVRDHGAGGRKAP